MNGSLTADAADDRRPPARRPGRRPSTRSSSRARRSRRRAPVRLTRRGRLVLGTMPALMLMGIVLALWVGVGAA